MSGCGVDGAGALVGSDVGGVDAEDLAVQEGVVKGGAIEGGAFEAGGTLADQAGRRRDALLQAVRTRRRDTAA